MAVVDHPMRSMTARSGTPKDEQYRRGRVPRIVQTPVPDVRLCQQCLPLSPVPTVGRATAVLIREDQTVFHPALPCHLPLRFLCLQVGTE
jgi:hypothetical protein